MGLNFLRETLAKESRAYGFTIAFWGSGAMLIKSHGVPGLEEALLYGLGAVIGFGLLSIAVYRSGLRQVDYQRSDMVVLAMVHYLAALLPIIAASYLSKMGPYSSFLLTGISVSVLYNLGMVLEEFIDKKMAEII